MTYDNDDHDHDHDDDNFQVQLLERQLGGSEGDEGRLAALRTLTTTQVGEYLKDSQQKSSSFFTRFPNCQLSDLVGGTAWASLLPGLQRALGDQDPQVDHDGDDGDDDDDDQDPQVDQDRK